MDVYNAAHLYWPAISTQVTWPSYKPSPPQGFYLSTNLGQDKSLQNLIFHFPFIVETAQFLPQWEDKGLKQNKTKKPAVFSVIFSSKEFVWYLLHTFPELLQI